MSLVQIVIACAGVLFVVAVGLVLIVRKKPPCKCDRCTAEAEHTLPDEKLCARCYYAFRGPYREPG